MPCTFLLYYTKVKIRENGKLLSVTVFPDMVIVRKLAKRKWYAVGGEYENKSYRTVGN